MEIRPYQREIINQINGLTGNTCVVSPTGSGKSVIIGEYLTSLNNALVIAHRSEILSQLSSTLASFKISHNIIGSNQLMTFCRINNKIKHGTQFIDRKSPIVIASVDTLRVRPDSISFLSNLITTTVTDEAHHVLRDNKWGKCLESFPRARHIGFTATPVRADKKGLHAESKGVFENFILGPSGRFLIQNGFLSDYRIFSVPPSIQRGNLKTGTTGDFTLKSVNEHMEKSKIVGDILDNYRKRADGKKAIIFTYSLQSSKEISEKFNSSGIPSHNVDGNLPANIRNKKINDFRNGTVRVLVNVDILGEGFDVPDCEVVIMARPTKSYAVFSQQFGRALRPSNGKSHAIIFDHVGNVPFALSTYGLPDAPKQWDYYGNNMGKPRVAGDRITKFCPQCFSYVPYLSKSCPECGHTPENRGRDGPQLVDGDLTEYDAATIQNLLGSIADKNRVKYPLNASVPIIKSLDKKHENRTRFLNDYESAVSKWAGNLHYNFGFSKSEIYRIFWDEFRTDLLSVKLLPTKEIQKFTDGIINYDFERILEYLTGSHNG